MWAKGQPIAGTFSHDYLRQWGYRGGPLPSLRHYELVHPGTGEVLSSLLGAVVGPDGTLEAIEQVNLIDASRRAMSRILIGQAERGGIWVGQPDEKIGVALTIEAACILQSRLSLPIVVVTLPRRLGDIVMPPIVREVVLFTDQEGPDAARSAQHHYMDEGLTVTVEPCDGLSWEDLAP